MTTTKNQLNLIAVYENINAQIESYTERIQYAETEDEIEAINCKLDELFDEQYEVEEKFEAIITPVLVKEGNTEKEVKKLFRVSADKAIALTIKYIKLTN